MRKLFLLISLFLLTGMFLQAQVDVTFQVDMSVVDQLETFNPSTDTVLLRGSFNGWGDGVPMSDAGDLLYTVTLTGQPQNTDIFYKFFHQGGGGTWESDPNREINTGTSATLTVDPSFFNDKTPYTGVQSPVTFTVDMHLPAQGNFDPATDSVLVAGNFTNWGTDAVMLDDPEGDTTFTVTIDVDSVISGDILIYKFIYTEGTTRNWETNPEGDDIIPGSGGNRIYGVHDGSYDVSRFWTNTDPNVQLADGNIFFEVDMSVLTELGVFDPNVDSVQIRGAFNGWGASDPDKALMTQDAADPDHWTIEIPFIQEVLNSNQLYKFFINDADTNYSNTGWEVPIRTTNGSDRNRGVIFQGDPLQSAPYTWFENINPDWVIPAGTTVECTFRVDMTYAANPDTQSVPFVAGTDTVWWIPRQPLYYAVNGLPWPGDYPRVLELTDPDMDMIYEGTLVLNGPSYNGWLYNYAYSSGTELIHEGPGGPGSPVNQGDARVRFVGQSGGARMFDTPWTMDVDVWSNSPLPEEDHPEGWIDNVREIPGNPQTYSLEQNYPNPFNPSTTIRFSVPEQGLVTLKVFNLLGEQVAILINSELAKGSYEINFKGANFSSGIYFYTLNAGNFVSTKKMILLK